MSVIPCQKNRNLEKLIREYAEVLKTEAHTLGAHGLDERDFYDSGLFRGVIERIRGQFSSTMREKREFARDVLNYMQDRGFIQEWESTGQANRHDYLIVMPSGAEDRLTQVSHYQLTPPCIYVFPPTIPSPRNNPRPLAQSVDDVLLLKAFHECFGGVDSEVNYVDFEIEHREADTIRRSRIRRADSQIESGWTAIRRA
jgi:hypothetical protein